jgi:hypothetical protein
MSELILSIVIKHGIQGINRKDIYDNYEGVFMSNKNMKE